MKQIQLVGTTLEEHYAIIFNHFDKKFEEFKNSKQAKQLPTYLTRKETAAYLRVNLSTLHNWHHKGILTPKSIGNRVLYDLKAIQERIVELKK